MPHALAKLRFQKLSDPMTGFDEWGEITLHQNGTVRLSAGEGLRSRLLRTGERVDKAALMYGAGAFMGIAAVGTALVLKRRTLWGYLLLALAGLVALSGSGVRTVARKAPRLFERLLDKNDVSAVISPEGGLTITLADRPWRGTTLRFEAGEFDMRQATAFISLLRGHKSL
ncbi:MAG: hypothetical protein H7145_05370 [Akkermansiaceae bacterium]|nr:hypothetical protein [Armatimonadota bacterium]